MDANLYHLRLPQELARAAHQLAQRRRLSVGQMLRDLLMAEISKATEPDTTKLDDDAELTADNRGLLSGLLAGAADWNDLQQRLQAEGYVLQPSGNGLSIHRVSDKARICKTSELGHSYGVLATRFAGPFPNHPHAWMADRMLNTRPRQGVRLNQVIHDGKRSQV